jgi:uncharacterized protein YjbI with pentapeptide repeats
MNDPATNCLERILTANEKAGLRGERFVTRELIGIDLSGADLRGAAFEKTLLVECSLAGADLRGATFNLCDLRGVNFGNTVFGDNRFDGTTIVDPVRLDQQTRVRIEEWGGTFQPAHASPR